MMRHGFLEGRAAMRISVAWILLLYISVCAQDPDIEGDTLLFRVFAPESFPALIPQIYSVRI